ncbi:lipid-A-disaccharide synthase [compost metagenome]
MPGSKPFKVKYITPLLLKAADLLYENDPSIQFVLHQSPFTPLSQIQTALDDERLHQVTGGCGGRLVQGTDGPMIVTPGGATVRILGPEHHYSGMAVADLALTVPGTNTAELAILGVPMIVLLPLNKPEEIPLDGLAGQIGNLPLIGKPLKRTVVRTLAKRLKFAALPNQRAGSAITPELVGVISPQDVATLSEAILGDPARCRAIRLALHQAMGQPGAAAQTVDVIREVLARHAAPAVPQRAPAVPGQPDADA